MVSENRLVKNIFKVGKKLKLYKNIKYIKKGENFIKYIMII